MVPSTLDLRSKTKTDGDRRLTRSRPPQIGVCEAINEHHFHVVVRSQWYLER